MASRPLKVKVGQMVRARFSTHRDEKLTVYGVLNEVSEGAVKIDGTWWQRKRLLDIEIEGNRKRVVR